MPYSPCYHTGGRNAGMTCYRLIYIIGYMVVYVKRMYDYIFKKETGAIHLGLLPHDYLPRSILSSIALLIKAVTLSPLSAACV